MCAQVREQGVALFATVFKVIMITLYVSKICHDLTLIFRLIQAANLLSKTPCDQKVTNSVPAYLNTTHTFFQ